MQPRDIARHRMYQQHVWGRQLVEPEDVVGWLGAMQSQEFAYARWSVAQRSSRAGVAHVDRAFSDGAILRTHMLRPTWHFVLPQDIRWMQALTGPRVHAASASYYRKLELDTNLLSRTDVLIAKILEGGRQLTRKEVAAKLSHSGIEASGMRLAYMMMHAELEAIICSGVMSGKQHTYALVEERAPNAKALDRDDALAELTRRYFTSRGPATLKDFSWWSSLTMADGRRAIEMVKAELQHETIDGRTFWFAGQPQPRRSRSTRVDLVQIYDELVVSYSLSRDALTSSSIVLEEAGFPHAVLLDGQWLGRWRQARTGDSVVIETSLTRELDEAETKALDSAIERYGGFLGVPATWRRGPA